MTDPLQCLKHVRTQMKPDGTMYFSQTFQEKKMWITDVIKPILCWITTVDFGRTTYEADFLSIIKQANMKVERMETLSSGLFNTTTMRLVTVAVNPQTQCTSN